MKKPRSLRDVLRSLTGAELLWRFETTDPEFQGPIALELGRRKCREAVPLLMARLSSPDARLREAAAEALGRIGDASVGAGLLRLFEDASQPEAVRDTCAFALGRLRFEPAVTALISALTDLSRTVRVCAVAALAAIGREEIRRDIELVSEVERDPQVRQAMQRAAASLGSSVQPEGVPAPSTTATDLPQEFPPAWLSPNLTPMAPPELPKVHGMGHQKLPAAWVKSARILRREIVPEQRGLQGTFNEVPGAAA